MTAIAEPQEQPDHGDPNKWATLNEEETRCISGLKSYYIRIEGKPEDTAAEMAWEDLKKEFERLQVYIWWR